MYALETNLFELTGIVLIAISWAGLTFSMYAFHFFPVAAPKNPKKNTPAQIIVAICARNEENVIDGLLTALRKQTRPADKIFVIADNCSDDTAGIARRLGAVVFEKKQSDGGGKAEALQFALGLLRHEKFDGVVFLDADVTPRSDFLENLIKPLAEADLTIACHKFFDSPVSWSEAANTLSAHAMWHLYFQPRYRTGVLSLILGTAYAVRRSFLEKLQWKPQTLTEDLAFTADAALANAAFALCPGAVFQDKQPDTWLVS